MLNGTEYNNMATRLANAKNINQSEILNGAANKNARLIGETYLNKTWNVSTLFFYNYSNAIEGFPIKYELKSKSLEVLINKTIKLIDCSRIRHFIWIDSLTQSPHYFVNGKELKFTHAPMIGFFEILVEGKINLFEKVEVELVNANFNPLLASRPEEASIVKREIYFIEKEKMVYPVKNKKEFLALLNSKELNEFLNSKRLKVTKKEDLIELVQFYNTLAN